MNKNISIVQVNVNTDEEIILYEGICSYLVKDDEIQINYSEVESNITVQINANSQSLSLQRDGELQTNLLFIEHKTTSNQVVSPYGLVEVTIYTYRYIYEEDVLSVDYDIVNNEETTDSYQIIFQIEEVRA